jgi:uncharacterized protein
MPSFLSPLIRDGASCYRLINERTGKVVAERLLAAFDSASRRTGLLKHTALPDNEAIIIAPCNSVHTFFMKFTIDVIYVTRDGIVKKVSHAVRPWRMSASLGAFATIECAEGVARAAGLRENDRVLVSQKPAHP